ncbi:two component transcriptional regulator, LuxR family [Paenibacillus sp. UNCCL117]|uniref:response regulator n=1 Tax=unclassified Paenibacillus TaxID=185978 RepID=UPI000888F6EF|nr:MULTISPECIES: response regulator transcription factor [unclassified Paenibacillus]SDD05517.1 DNA-binding response regulator, NarL/FixJ family, contains REC and HTH domains [Paenibacillus sp. cl123]SFW31880.1 two component transcriptional regulator, LuxR family [Paenibacillus sp. UNCCL117]
MIKVVVADAHRIVNEGVKLILEREAEIEVIGDAAAAQELIELCGRLQPCIALVDAFVLKEGGGVEVVRQLRTKHPATKIIIFTSCTDAGCMLQAIQSGASGYILKDIHPRELVLTIKSVAAGLSIMDKQAMRSFTEQAGISLAAVYERQISPDPGLTDREVSIIRHIVEGMENREIARSLFMSEGTIKNTVSGILRKLDLRDRIQLVVFAIRNGLA